MLLNDNYEECHRDDLLMCDCLLAEAYWHTSKGWCIAPLAQEIYDKLVGLFVKDAEKLQAYSQVIARICLLLARNRASAFDDETPCLENRL